MKTVEGKVVALGSQGESPIESSIVTFVLFCSPYLHFTPCIFVCMKTRNFREHVSFYYVPEVVLIFRAYIFNFVCYRTVSFEI